MYVLLCCSCTYAFYTEKSCPQIIINKREKNWLQNKSEYVSHSTIICMYKTPDSNAAASHGCRTHIFTIPNRHTHTHSHLMYVNTLRCCCRESLPCYQILNAFHKILSIYSALWATPPLLQYTLAVPLAHIQLMRMVASLPSCLAPKHFPSVDRARSFALFLCFSTNAYSWLSVRIS